MKNRFAVLGSWVGGIEYVAVLGMIAMLVDGFSSHGRATTLHAVVSLCERVLHAVQ